MKRGGGPERGNAANTIWRIDARPVGSPRQNGELAESASSVGRCDEQAVHDLDRLLRIVDGDVDVHAEDQLAARDVLELVDEVR